MEIESVDRLRHLLWEVSWRANALTESAFADVTIGYAGIGLLDHVIAEPGITAAEVARRLPKTAQAIGQTAARLEKLGLLERRLAAGRGVGLHATPAGERAWREGDAAEVAAEERLKELLGAERYATLLASLDDTRTALDRGA